ncbi:MarR family winged helix-turn-helix transcriptional regulator [Fluviicola sp.]|jgi:DNA-binding MarR family transcriptional regulator|uniref:MarR family winged helix-turn-helix transcriptional regulator n=1 Tax=Fluviicola sp. TaxID=1917219 RepID=UPI002824EA1D|nr:MarR family winged helix-turn-helix transcriptional regulator [Fluviicola sp.]MDR0802895.1 MarR family winged helix-turn-helix transcriptional regulator [Fluviicola sp.]
MNAAELASALRIAVTTLHKGLRKELAESTGYSTTELQTIGLILKSSGILPTELARITRITTQSMSQILSKLEKQGMISKVPSQTDKRKVLVYMTPFGEEIIKKTLHERDQWLIQAFEKVLDETDLKSLKKAIPALQKLAIVN